MTAFRFLLLGLIWASLSLGVQAQKLQIETQNGQKFIMHTVQPKESLWGIAKLYDVSTDEIVKHNPGVDKVLKHGTKIKIPYTEAATSPKTYQSANQAELEISNAPTTHTVQPKEWLNKIAKEYGVTVEEIKKWNGLEGETISPGQELIVGIGKSQAKNKNQPTQPETAKNPDKPTNTTKNQALKSPAPGEMTYHTVAEGEGLYSIAKKYGASIEEVQAWNGLSNTQIKAGDKLKIYKSSATTALIHKVAAKETLFGIALRYDVKKEQILEWNQLKEEKVLVGQSLKIYPGPKATLNPTTPYHHHPAPGANQSGHGHFAQPDGKHSDQPRHGCFAH
ncbi:MAG: LysM peptidoglycan-binding domain-containing protein [Microscillaceae bacterium]|nr:LysM peptidoglycan-binding domain-containing protein [Microscillaceae bacterium]